MVKYTGFSSVTENHKIFYRNRKCSKFQAGSFVLYLKKLGNRANRCMMLNCFEELQFDDCFYSQPYIEHFPTSNAIY